MVQQEVKLMPGDQVKVVNARCVYYGKIGSVIEVSENALGVWVNVLLPNDLAHLIPTGSLFLSTELVVMPKTEQKMEKTEQAALPV